MLKPLRVLVIVLIAAVVVCGVILAIHYSSSSSSGNDVLAKEMQTAVQNLSESLYEYAWVLSEGIVSAAGDLSGVPADDPISTNILMDLYVENPGVLFVFRADVNGSVVCSTPSMDAAGYQIPSSVLNLDDVSTDLYLRTFTDVTGVETTCLLSPIFSTEGVYEGVIGIAGYPRNLFAVPIDQFRNATGYDVWIVNSQGQIPLLFP